LVIVPFYGQQPPTDLLGFLLVRSEDDTAKRNPKKRKWTRDDVRELKSLAREKKPATKIARSLKRTLGATRQKAFTLGVSLDSRG
jgi:hypothetical protein